MMGEGVYKRAIEQEEIVFIVEQYNINGNKYQIMYKEDIKASEVFNALNRMLVSGKDRDVQEDIQIIKMFEPTITTIESPKREWWRF